MDCFVGMRWLWTSFMVYSPYQQAVFCAASGYCSPVTFIMNIMRNPYFDLRAQHFFIEIADITFFLFNASSLCAFLCVAHKVLMVAKVSR